MDGAIPGALSGPQGLHLNSWHFLLLAGAAVLLLRALPVARPRQWLLAVLNVYFVSFFIADLRSAVALGVLLAVVYALGRAQRRWADSIPAWWLPAIVAALWALLFLVKDPNLFPAVNPFHDNVVRVIGISFLMFRCINYVVDAEVLDDPGPVTFLNYMLFFPTLLAGPIERIDSFQRWHDEAKAYEPQDVMALLHRIANGCIKKFVIADNIAAFGIFEHPDAAGLSPILILASVLLQIFIILMDFSGYCDIVIGIAGLMGFRLMENFNRPFLAVNLQEFWTRWHISLTSFIRDYVFNPLSRATLRSAPRPWHFPIFLGLYVLTMLLIALWHGTTWGFLVFGLLHAAVLVAIQLKRRYLGTLLPGQPLLAAWGARVSTYVYVSLTVTLWYYGVAGSLAIFSRMLGFK
jgi:alginate O-acetyltransferase complex protein AlgI